MKEKSKYVLVVCGYGTKLSATLRDYLQEVSLRAEQLIAKGNDVYIITSGGATSSSEAYEGEESENEDTEAKIMADYLHKLGFDRYISLEDESLTTQENIWNSLDLIERKFDLSDLEVEIFCGKLRSWEVRLTVANTDFPERDHITVSSYPATEESSLEWLKATGSLFLSLFGSRGHQLKKKVRRELYGEGGDKH